MRKLRVLAVGFVLLATTLASSAFVFPARAAQSIPLTGTMQAIETYSSDPQNTVRYVSGEGSGNATTVGRFTLSYQVTVSLATGGGPASTQWTAASGDRLFGEGHGQSAPTGDPEVFSVVERYTITGGTGRYAGATGSFTVSRLVNVTTGVTSGSITGSIALR